MKQDKDKLIIKNFNQAALEYDKNALIQRHYAKLLAGICSKQKIPSGLWADLGTGTGMLADAIERLHPNQLVIRVDGSKEMLKRHINQSQTKLFNLNSGVPDFGSPPSLIASSFCLHWLNKPTLRLKGWFQSLAKGGWLALAVPIEGSFEQWHQAALKSNIICSALNFPKENDILNTFNSKEIRYYKISEFTQTAPNIFSLLKPIKKIGAHSSEYKSLKLKQWRQLEKSWPLVKQSHEVELTWRIQLILVQK